MFSTSIGSIKVFKLNKIILSNFFKKKKVWNKINFKLIKELQNDIQGLGEIWTSCLSDRYFMAAGSTGKVLVNMIQSKIL